MAFFDGVIAHLAQIQQSTCHALRFGTRALSLIFSLLFVSGIQAQQVVPLTLAEAERLALDGEPGRAVSKHVLTHLKSKRLRPGNYRIPRFESGWQTTRSSRAALRPRE